MTAASIVVGLAVLASAVSFPACGDDRTDAVPSATGTRATATATVAAPSSTTTVSAAPIRRMELPRDQAGAWSPRAVISGTEQVVAAYDPIAHSPEAQREVSGRMGLMPLAGGAVRELHTTAPGQQIGRVAHDGRYLAWVEVGVFGASPLAWSLFAIDLDDPGAAPWEVDSGPGDLPWLPVQGPPLALADGMLVYSHYLPEGDDWRNELVVVDLARSTSATAGSGLISADGHITAVAVNGDSFAWVRRKMGVNPPSTDSTLFEASRTSFASPVTTVAGVSLFEIVLADRSAIVATVADGLLVRDTGATQFERLSSSAGIPMHLSVVGDRAYWVDTGAVRPMSLSLGSRTPSALDDEDALMVFVDGQTVAWWTKRGDQFLVSWIEVRP